MEKVTAMSGYMTDLEKMVLSLANQMTYGLDVEDIDVEENEDFDPIMDFMETVLDIEWIVSSDKQTLNGARLLVTFGGPNIWIDMKRGIVEGYWYTERAEQEFDLRSETSEQLLELLDTLWNC